MLNKAVDNFLFDKVIRHRVYSKYMKYINLLCEKCKIKLRKAEAKYRKEYRRKLNIKVVAPETSGSVKIKIIK